MHTRTSPTRSCAATLLLAAGLLAAAPVAALEIAASDSGFVTEMGGSAKGDGSFVPVATYNYSVGFEVHYDDGALGVDFAPMLRKNYFVFDLSAVTMPIASAKLSLYTGTFESVDPFEVYALHAPAVVPLALSLATDLAAGDSTDDFDDPDDELVLKAKDLYGLLATGPDLALPLFVSSAIDETTVEIEFTPPGLAFLDSFAGGTVLLSGFVPSVDGDPLITPQQPFGFTGPDITGGDPLTPTLIITVVPEPPVAWMMLGGAMLLGWRIRRPSARRPKGPARA